MIKKTKQKKGNVVRTQGEKVNWMTGETHVQRWRHLSTWPLYSTSQFFILPSKLVYAFYLFNKYIKLIEFTEIRPHIFRSGRLLLYHGTLSVQSCGTTFLAKLQSTFCEARTLSTNDLLNGCLIAMTVWHIIMKVCLITLKGWLIKR